MQQVEHELLEERWRLLEQFAKVSQAERESLGKNAADYQSFYEEARRLRFDPKWVATFKTSPEEKKRYGEDKLGMGCLMAKNLLAANAGTHFVYVYGGDIWDHHGKMLDRSGRNNLYVTAGGLDTALSSLLEDLGKLPGAEAGKTLLDETLILATSEFGRTPEMNPGGGTDHYPGVYTQLWAGGGVKGGRVVGASDSRGIEPSNDPVKPEDVAATIYQCLGIDYSQSIASPEGVRITWARGGTPIRKALA